MQICDLLILLLYFEVSVKKTHCKEESLVVTLEISENFDHPVNHPCSQSRGNLVMNQAIIRYVGLLKLARVSFDFLAVLHFGVYVLTLDLGGVITTQMERWVLADETLRNSLVQRCISASLARCLEEMRVVNKSLNQM